MPPMGVVSNRPRISPVAGLMEAIEEERAAWELIPVILPELSSAAPVFLPIGGDPANRQGQARLAGHARYAAPGFQRSGYSTDTMHRPCGGTAGPDLDRSHSSNKRGMSSGASLPRPTSNSVPTILRTMNRRNDFPRTSKSISSLPAASIISAR